MTIWRICILGLVLTGCTAATSKQALPAKTDTAIRTTSTAAQEPQETITTEATITITDTPTPILTPTDYINPFHIGVRIPRTTPDARLEISKSNRKLPKDIIEELVYSDSGGGHDDQCETNPPNKLSVFPEHKIYQLGEIILYDVCGFTNPKTEYEVIIESPEGKELYKSFSEIDWGIFWLELSFPIGNYRIISKSKEETSESTFKVIPSIGPKLVWKQAENLIYLYNFQSNEHIRLVTYGYDYNNNNDSPFKFDRYNEFQTNSDGTLLISYDPDELMGPWAIVGDISGVVKAYRINFRHNIWAGSFCPDAPYTRMDVGQRGSVCTFEDRLIVRQGPNRNEGEITRLVTWSNFIVLDGPICANQWAWWKILTEDEVVGWVAEGGGDDEYFICPYR